MNRVKQYSITSPNYHDYGTFDEYHVREFSARTGMPGIELTENGIPEYAAKFLVEHWTLHSGKYTYKIIEGL